MFRSIRFAHYRGMRRSASAFAMAAMLAASGVAGTAFLAAPAQAQDYSKGFVSVYQPVADVVNAEGADIAAAKAEFPAVIAAAETPDDRYAAGSLILSAGNKAEDAQLQRQGLELMVESGQTDPAQLGQFQYFIGSLAFAGNDFPAARQAFEAAQAAGYSDPEADIEGLIAESYFAENNAQGGIDYVKRVGQERMAAGGQIPERWLLKSLQAAYDGGLAAEATEISGLLIANYPTERNWMNTLQVIGAMSEFAPQEQLDLLRLMRETNAMSDRSEYVRYIEAADPRIMSNEVNDVLAAGLAAGEFTADDTYYVEVKGIADERAPMDRSEAPSLVSEAEGSSDPMLAAEAGDVVFSLSEFAQAEAMYQKALDNGHAQRDTILTRLGIAQVKQGKFAEAQANFEQVTGSRAPIAQMWAYYAQSKAGGGAAPAAAAPAAAPAPEAAPAG